MKRTFTISPIYRALIIRRVLEVLAIIVLIGLILFLLGLVRQGRVEAWVAQLALEREPVEILQRESLKAELRDRQHDINRIEELILSRDQIGEFVGSLERIADQRNVIVQVPSIAERPNFDEQGQEIPWEGPFREIAFELSVFGEPTDLLAFLHELEHAPFLVQLLTWNMQAVTVTVPGLSIPAPPAGPTGQQSQSTALTRKPGRLEVLAVLTILNTGSDVRSLIDDLK